MKSRFGYPSRFGAAFAAGAFLCGGAAADHRVSLFPADADEVREGFVRVINHAGRAGEIRIEAIDDAGNRATAVTMAIDANKTIHFNSEDLEKGNASKGLPVGVGSGDGDWRLELSGELDFEVLSYIRTTDGFVTSMHDVVPLGEDGRHRVAIFNPATNNMQVSRLRLINRDDDPADVSITGIDGDGQSPGDEVRITIPGRGATTLTAQELEAGGTGFEGSLGDGEEKWQLLVTSESPITVMSLIRSPEGHQTNLSTAPVNRDARGAHTVPMFPAASDPLGRQGFVRVINHGSLDGNVIIDAFDDTGSEYSPVVLSIDALETVHFNSDDLELGNVRKGLSGGVGAGEGDWRLALSTELDVEILAYVRTEEDFLTAMHNIVPSAGNRHRVAFFNPGMNREQVSRLRLVNPTSSSARVTITGLDTNGVPSLGEVSLSIEPESSRTLTAQALEAGGEGFTGALGAGKGKWQLFVESDATILVMSLLASPTGHLTNLSTIPSNVAPANAAAYHDRVAGTRLVGRDPASHTDYLSRGGFRETMGTSSVEGTYTYTNTGPTTGVEVRGYDDGTTCTVNLVFETRTSGHSDFSCDDGESGESVWRLVDAPKTYIVGETIGTLPGNQWTPDAIHGATVTEANGITTVNLDDGGYVEEGDYRYTCEGTAGCVITGRDVTAGSIAESMVTPARSFDLDPDNDTVAGMVHGNGRFYVADRDDNKAYAYRLSGQRDPDADFDLDSDNGSAEGIAFGGGHFYVLDSSEHKVFAYDPSGQRQQTSDVALDGANDNPRRIAHAGGRLYVLDEVDRRAYAYGASGGRESSAEFELDLANVSLGGIAHGDGRFYVADTADDKVYVYRTSGERDEEADFDLVDANGIALGIAHVDGRWYVVDRNRVFAYPSGRPDLIVDSPAVSNARPDASRPFTLEVTIRNVGDLQSPSTTLRYYRSRDERIGADDTEVHVRSVPGLAVARARVETVELSAPSRAGFYYYGACVEPVLDESYVRNCSDAVAVTVPVDLSGASDGFVLDDANRNPTGIAHANERFYVADESSDKVYAYLPSGAPDPAFDFDLADDNGSPVDLVHATSTFHVLDRSDDKVYAYRENGERDPDGDFDLDPDNRAPQAIAHRDGHFYIVDDGESRVFAYEASGNRRSALEFDLSRANTMPWGLESFEDRFYVVDFFDRIVYAYRSRVRAAGFEFALDPDNRAPEGLTYVDGRFYVVDHIRDRVYGYALPRSADLTLESTSANSTALLAGEAFNFATTVRNLGDQASGATTVRYYMSSDPAYAAAESLVATDSIPSISPDETFRATVELTAPEDEGCYFCGACVDSVSGERVTGNNCSEATVAIRRGDPPELDFSRLSVRINAGRVQMSVGVINRGVGDSAPGKLKITGGYDTQVDIPALEPDEEETFLVDAGPAPSESTTYDICIDVPCEDDTDNNCRTRSVNP